MARSKTNQQDLKSKYLTSSLNLPLAASSSTSPWPPSGTTSKCSCPSKLQKNISSKNKPFHIGWSVGIKYNKRQKLRFSTVVASRKQQATWTVIRGRTRQPDVYVRLALERRNIFKEPCPKPLETLEQLSFKIRTEMLRRKSCSRQINVSIKTPLFQLISRNQFPISTELSKQVMQSL